MWDVLRFVCWGVSLLSGLWCLAYVDPTLVRVSLPNEKELRAISKGSEGYAVVDAAPSASASLLVLYDALQRAEFPGALSTRTTRGGVLHNVYLQGKDPLYQALNCASMPISSVEYVRFRDGESTKVLCLNRVDIQHITAFAPSRLARPLQPVGLFLIGAGWCLFWLIPWRQRPREEIHYSRWAGVIGPFLVGTILGATIFFLALEVPIANTFADFSNPTRAYSRISAVALTLTTPAYVIWVIAIYFGSFALRLDQDKLVLSRFGRRVELAAENIEKVVLENRTPPRWVWILVVLVAILRPLRSGPILVGTLRDNPVLRIWTKDRKQLKFSIDGLLRLWLLRDWFKEKGIGVENRCEEGEPESWLEDESQEELGSSRAFGRKGLQSFATRLLLASPGLVLAVVQLPHVGGNSLIV